MKEIIIRRSIYDETKEHKLVKTDVENEWLFVPAESWMPTYITYGNNNLDFIVAFDSDGFGHQVVLGDVIKDLNTKSPAKDKIVKKIYYKGEDLIVVLEDIEEKNEQQ